MKGGLCFSTRNPNSATYNSAWRRGCESAVRLDLFLKEVRLFKRRTLAKEACEAGRVTVGGVRAKAGREIRVGDRIELSLPGRRLVIEVQRLPAGNVSKTEAAELYRILHKERLPPSMDDEREQFTVLRED